MIESLALGTALVSVVAALVIGVRGMTRRFRWDRARPVLAVIEVALVVQALVSVIALARGHHPHEPATFLAYLAVSVVLLPAALSQTARDDGRWSAGLLAVALLAVCVVVVRAQTTWRAGVH